MVDFIAEISDLLFFCNRLIEIDTLIFLVHYGLKRDSMNKASPICLYAKLSTTSTLPRDVNCKMLKPFY